MTFRMLRKGSEYDWQLGLSLRAWNEYESVYAPIIRLHGNMQNELSGEVVSEIS